MGAKKLNWASGLLGTFAITGVVALGIGTAVLAPYWKAAQTYDIAAIDGSEHAKLISGTSHLPQHLIDALTATEDSRFFDHGGWDPKGIGRAAFVNFRKGEVAEGASTLTQQLARNAYEIREERFAKKAIEIFLARRIEEKYTKDQILTHYLNEVYFGNSYYGIEAAAQGYYSKPASALTLAESATLVGLIKRPSSYNPVNNPKAARKVRDHSLRRMHLVGAIDDAQLAAALEEAVVPER